MSVRTAALFVCLAAFLAVAAPAHAATLSSDGTRITYTAGAGEKNDLLIDTYSGGDGTQYIRFTDFGATITPSAPCVEDFGEYFCPVASSMTVSLADGDDRIRGDVSGQPLTNDTIDGGAGQDSVTGGPGADLVQGGAGNDTLEGNSACADEGYAGPDLVSGGEGVDVLNLICRDSAVDASLDGVANDGEQGEGDNYGSDIENVDGGGNEGGGGTNFVGTDGPNVFNGGNSNDTAEGRGGNDVLVGSCGTDDLKGGDGDDRLEGGCAGDRLEGGPGQDVVVGDDPCFGLRCTGGGDTIFVRDGFVDNVGCGTGADAVTADRQDLVATDAAEMCESVDVPKEQDGSGKFEVTGDGTAGTATPNKRRVFTLKGHKVDCAGAGADCAVRTKATAKVASTSAKRTVKLGGSKFTVRTGKSGKIKVKLTKKGMKRLKQLETIKAKVVVRVTRGTQSSKQTVKVKLKAP